jgi:hypothetical protein
MSHEIEKPIDQVFSISGTEWHGLAEHVQEITAPFLKARGVFFPIRQGTVLNSLTDGRSFKEITASIHAAIEANNLELVKSEITALGLAEIDTHKNVIADFSECRPDLVEAGMPHVPLHVTKTSYEVIPNSRVFEVVEKAFDAPIVTAGTLQGGQVFFMSLDIGGRERSGPRGDVYSQFLDCITSHNGTLGTRFYDSTTRIVCMNTLRASLSSKGMLDFCVYHTKGADAALNKVSNDLTKVFQQRNEFFTTLELLDLQNCSTADARALFVAYTLEEARNANPDASDEISTQVYNRAEEIGSLFVRGAGNRGATLYDAFQAVTDCFSNGIGAGKTATRDKKFLAGKFGRAAEIKEGYLPFLAQPADIIAGHIETGTKALASYAAMKA